MIYTAIYQNSQGKLSHEITKSNVSRIDAWLDAAKEGGANDQCLVALVPGVHPVYFYSDFVKSLSVMENNDVKNHDLFDNK